MTSERFFRPAIHNHRRIFHEEIFAYAVDSHSSDGFGVRPGITRIRKKNEVLRIITWSCYAPQELPDEFTEETEYRVEVTLSNNKGMIGELRATRGCGFNLAQSSRDRVLSVVEQYGIYQPIDYSRIDESQIDFSLLAAVKNTLIDGQSYAVLPV